jgi:uncharacterized protein
LLYAEGYGVEQDLAQAVALFRKGADQGNAQAQYNLGSIYAKGQGVPQDFVQALGWFSKAAENGDAGAQTALGWMYADGQEGTPQDFAQAVHWFGKAADQGNAYAQANLGWLYANGQGVEQDDTQALMWSTLAAMRGQDDATRELALKVRDSLTARMTPPQIAEAQRMARERFPK